MKVKKIQEIDLSKDNLFLGIGFLSLTYLAPASYLLFLYFLQ